MLSAPGYIPIPSAMPALAASSARSDLSSGAGLDVESDRPDPGLPKKSASFADDLQRVLSVSPVVVQHQGTELPAKLPSANKPELSVRAQVNLKALGSTPPEGNHSFDPLPASLAAPIPIPASSQFPFLAPGATIIGIAHAAGTLEPGLTAPAEIARSKTAETLVNKNTILPTPTPDQAALVKELSTAIPGPARFKDRAATPTDSAPDLAREVQATPGLAALEPRAAALPIPAPNGTKALPTTGAEPPAHAQKPVSLPSGLPSQILPEVGGKFQAEQTRVADVAKEVSSTSLPVSSRLQELVNNALVRPPVPHTNGTIVGADFADLANRTEKKDGSGRNDSVKPKENSTNSARGAVNSDGRTAGNSAPSASEIHGRETQVPEQVAGSIIAHTELVAREGHAEFHLRLEPPELGSVRIVLTATDRGISARLFVHEPGARQLIQNQLESLRQRLMKHGIAVGRFDVGGNDAGSQKQERNGSETRPGNPWQAAKSGKIRSVRIAGGSGVRTVDVVV